MFFYLHSECYGDIMRDDIKTKIAEGDPSQINLSDMSIKDDELLDIINEIIRVKPDVQEIFLDKNKITDQGMIVLSQTLSSLPKLTFLDLQFNKTSLKGIEAIYSLKLNNQHLEFALFGNLVDDASAIDILEKKYRPNNL